MARAALSRALLALVLALSCGGAWAYSWPAGATIKAATNGVPVIAGAVTRGASVATSGGAAALRASQLLGIEGASAALTLSRGVGLSNLALVARIAAGAMGPLGIASLALTGIYWAADHWEVPSDPYPYPSGTTANRNFYQTGFGGQACDAAADHCSWSEVVAFWLAKEAAIYGGTWSFVSVSSDANCGTVNVSCLHTITIASGATNHTREIYSSGSDGPAPGAGVPATDAQLENAITTALQAQPTLSGSVLDAALAYKPAELALVTAPQTVTGPATVNGGTKTSTKVETAGTTTTTINTTYNLSYAGDVVTVTQTDVQTVTHPDSSTDTTTTTTSAPSGDPPPPEEKPDICKDHPEASGCAEFGEHDPEPDLQTEDRALSWVPALSAVGACPAPETATVHGQSISISWQPVCDLASGLRPVVLAVAWLSAGAFVFGVGRKVAA